MTAVEWPRMQRDLVAILRGVRPDEVEAIAAALIVEGLEAIEVPLNSPDPLASIHNLARAFGDEILVGGGTMLTVRDVEEVHAAGGRLFVSPNMRPRVIARAVELGMVAMPGVLTPTEALDALDAGASGLKFFPADILGPSGIAGIRVVLPKDTLVAAVGGVSAANLEDYMKAGVRAFGIGSTFYRPGDDAAAVRLKARAVIAAYDASCEKLAKG